MTHIPKDSLMLLSRRQLLGRLALGGAAALVLAACGGGGGDGDSDAGKSIDLLAVFNRLEANMSPEEVTKLVGREANDIGNNSRNWSEGNQSLYLTFNHGNSDQLSDAKWYQVGPSAYQSRIF